MDRRMRAAIAREVASILAENGRGGDALGPLGEAEAELADDPKLRVTLDATAALVYAVLGQRGEALARMTCAEANRLLIPDERTTQREAVGLMGMAALRLDDPARAESFFRLYLELQPAPVWLPQTHYYLAECRRRQGDLDGGRTHDRLAAATAYGTVYERLARERLAAEGAG
jgi:hypothetical protein